MRHNCYPWPRALKCVLLTLEPTNSPFSAEFCIQTQVVRQPPPEWEAEYQAWAEQRRLQQGFYKQYPAVVSLCHDNTMGLGAPNRTVVLWSSCLFWWRLSRSLVGTATMHALSVSGVNTIPPSPPAASAARQQQRDHDRHHRHHRCRYQQPNTRRALTAAMALPPPLPRQAKKASRAKDEGAVRAWRSTTDQQGLFVQATVWKWEEHAAAHPWRAPLAVHLCASCLCAAVIPSVLWAATSFHDRHLQ